MKNWKSIVLWVVLLSVVPTTLVPAAQGQQLRCDGTGGDSTSVDRLEIDDGKLVVFISWPQRVVAEAFATIEVLDRNGVTVASQTVIPNAGGRTAYEVTQNPDFFNIHGYWYSVRLTDGSGRELAPAIPGLVSFCEPGEGCVYTIVQGVGSNGLAMAGELHQVLESLEARGSGDLLGDALALRPDLQAQVSWVADQLDRLLTGVDTSQCLCQWVGESDQNPQDATMSYQMGDIPSGEEDPLWETLRLEGPGGNFGFAGQLHGGQTQTMPAYGEARGGLHLKCWRIPSWTLTQWFGLPIRVPVLEPCTRFCSDAAITVTASAQSQSAANAWASADQGARASTFASLDFFLGSQGDPVLSVQSATEADRPAGSLDEAPVEDFPEPGTGVWEVSGGEAVVAFEAFGNVEICVDPCDNAAGSEGGTPKGPSGGAGPWAYGCSTSVSRARLVGEASCALWPRHVVNLWPTAISSSQEGLLIVPWHP